MTELRKIVAARREWIAAGKRALLAHLVAVDGSHFRRPGARMLLSDSGESVGAISGGCLDADLRRRIPEVIASGRPALVEYDTGRPDDVVFGLGLGCGGRIGVLVSPLAGSEGLPDPLDAAAAARGSSVIATVVRSGASAADVGRQAWLGAGGEVVTRCGARLAAALRPILAAAARDRATTPFRAVIPGPAEILVEPIPEAVTLVLAGSGEELAVLARIGRELGWETETVLPRLPGGIGGRLGAAATGPVGSASDLPALGGERTAVVVATHNYLDDLEVLRAALATPVAYIGALGSRGRVARLAADAADAGDPSRIHGPAGLDVGAETPAEVALSIAAEIQAVLSDREGGSLRSTGAPIHTRTAGEPAAACGIGVKR